MGYYDSYNPDLLRFIPPDAEMVLEIGCGEGALCEAYRRVNPGVVWYGVEINESLRDIAKTRIDDFNCIDIEATGDYYQYPYYDCLILGDILEHLRDPWQMLSGLARTVKPGAQVLACIPNVQHWSVIRDLLEGKWEYTDSGLLDRTHLRFFTLDSIRTMFADAGLQVFEIVGRDLFNDGWRDFMDVFFDGSPSSQLDNGIDLDELKKTSRAYQYVVRAAKPHSASLGGFTHIEIVATPKLHIHAVTAEACCARPRILEPFAMLGTIPGVKCGVNAMIPPSTDIVILQRPRLPLCDKGILEAHRDKVLIVEIDDLPEAIGVDSDWLRGCHAIQCSTEALAEVCRQYNPNVMVFENQIAELLPMREFAPSESVTLFFGAQNRQPDWAPIMPALNRVIRAFRGTIKCEVIHDKEFYQALDLSSDKDEKAFRPFCDYAHYRAILRSCDIAILPLEDTPFNRCKSDIKFLECAAEGVAVIASRTIYDGALTRVEGYPIDRIERACTGIYSTPGEFTARLRTLIEEPATRLGYAERAYEYVRSQRLLSQHYRKRYEWYQSLISSKQALTDSLLERCPELAHPSHSQC